MRLTEAERKKANMLASMIDLSPHEWPKEQHEIQLLCHGYLNRVADNHNLRTRIADLEGGRTRLLDVIAQLGVKMTALEAERDAAKAGEARAGEALGRVRQQLQWIIDNGDTYQASALIDFVSRIRDNYFPISAQPALDWLAQREREAILAELRGLWSGWVKDDRFGPEMSEVWRYIRDRIAALTNQQPAACPRSEVRGVERFRA